MTKAAKKPPKEPNQGERIESALILVSRCQIEPNSQGEYQRVPKAR